MKQVPLMAAGIALVVASLACDTSSLLQGPEPERNSPTPPPTWTAQAVTETAAPTDNPTDTPIPATATVFHVLIPGEPPSVKRFVSDTDSSSRAGERSVTGGDNYSRNRFERPFTSQMMEYRPEVDITRVELTFDDVWFYFSIELAGAGFGNDSTQAVYAIELDYNRDGRGDWLLLVENPSTFAWSTDGVKVLLDIDGDVGGLSALQADSVVASGNGFDTPLFENGRGDDPDAAWARLDPAAESTVQLAAKREFLRSTAFLWGAWADAGISDPAMFDYVDRFSEVAAGSPLQGSNEYPLKEISDVDNTCRMFYGFTPTGSEPGLCLVFATVQNCTFHPMLMTPGNILLGDQMSASSIKDDVLPGTYSFHDQNVFDNDDNHPVVLTVTLAAGQSAQITEDGNGNTWSCP